MSLYRQLAWKLEGIRSVIISCGLSPYKREFVGVICRLLLLFHQSRNVSFWKEDCPRVSDYNHVQFELCY